MIDFKVIFDRRKEAKTQKEGLIEIQAYLRGSRDRKWFSTKIRIKPAEWNEKDRKVTTKCNDADKHNYYLDKYVQELKNLQFERDFKKQPFTFKDVKAYFKHTKEKSSSFIDFVKEEIQTDLSVKENTKKQHRNTLSVLQECFKEDVLFSDLNYAFVDRFINYLRGEKKYQKNTIQKHHKNLKKFISLAIKKEFTDIKNPCIDYKVATEQKPRDVLNISEVNALAKLKFNENETKLMQVRDMFLFACYTGLRISDVCALKNEYVKTVQGGLELDFFTIKVNKRAELPLYNMFKSENETTSLPEKILHKYMKCDEIFVFPKLSESYINETLKVLAPLVGIKFNLTFHIGRETFGTYMAGKAEPFYLMRLMQHSDIKTTMRYVHLNKKMMNEKLESIKWN